MEGVYFFGEHLRWNLGWENPNQAGAFVAMGIPWLWAWGRIACRSGAVPVEKWLALAFEMGLWFLLCKTYSRGALVAVVCIGLLEAGRRMWLTKRQDKWAPASRVMSWCRVSGVGLILVATGFFSRIDPRFVSQDASAGNRLTLWKGGVQMIAASPWEGWGKGESGPGFMHWFQPLDANEKYAGMVNSYLHIGVEYGLPLLTGVMAVGLWLWLTTWCPSLRARVANSGADWALSHCIAAAGASWAVFMICNAFSTLWVFPGLWWFPAADLLLILLLSMILLGMPVVTAGRKTLVAALALAVAGGAGLYATGMGLKAEVQVSPAGDGPMVVTSGRPTSRENVLFLPEQSVLGDVWGKEIRRLFKHEGWENKAIIPLPETLDLRWRNLENPTWIFACGNRFGEGFRALEKFPHAHLVLLHPNGKPPLAETSRERVILVLPMLDTRYSGRAWKVLAKQQGWKVVISPGVGQDIRPIWPTIFDDIGLPESHPRTQPNH